VLGPAKPRRLDAPITVSLEDLVPQSNFYRHLQAKLDLSFVREWTRSLYAARGRPSIDPVVFFKLQLVMFFEGIRSERQLIETASLNLAHRWYLGYALDEELPDHSSLTRIRHRLGIEIFQRFFEKVVDLCQDAGLVWGRELYFDATKVETNAGIPSLIPRFYYDAKGHLADLFADECAVEEAKPASTDDLPEGIVRLAIESNAEGVMIEDDPPWRLLEERRLDPGRPAKRGYRRTSDFRVSPTDPDASPMWDWGAIRLGYHDHYVVDGGKARVILAALVTPADVMESQAMRDLLWRVCFRRKLRPHHVTGDAKYGTIENIVAVEDAGIRAYLPLTDFEHRSDFYGRDKFIYDPERDHYSCPQGHLLPLARSKRTEGVVVYQGDPAICNACPVKAECTASDRGRTIQRSLYEAYLEKVRRYHTTEPYKKAIRKRQVWVEPMFAEAKEWHGLRRLRLRGLAERQHPGVADRGRTEPEALAGRDGVGAPPRTLWKPRGPVYGARAALSPLRVITHPAGDRAPVSRIRSTYRPRPGLLKAFFQHPEPFDDLGRLHYWQENGVPTSASSDLI
jgi:transposase